MPSKPARRLQILRSYQSIGLSGSNLNILETLAEHNLASARPQSDLSILERFCLRRAAHEMQCAAAYLRVASKFGLSAPGRSRRGRAIHRLKAMLTVTVRIRTLIDQLPSARARSPGVLGRLRSAGVLDVDPLSLEVLVEHDMNAPRVKGELSLMEDYCLRHAVQVLQRAAAYLRLASKFGLSRSGRARHASPMEHLQAMELAATEVSSLIHLLSYAGRSIKPGSKHRSRVRA